MAERKPQSESKYIVRFTEPGLHEALKSLAKSSGATLNMLINIALLAYVNEAGKRRENHISMSEDDLNKLADKVALRLRDVGK